MELTCKVDAGNLNRAIEVLLAGYTKRTPAIAVNTAAFMVARRTFWKMPVVTPQRMDLELTVATVTNMRVATRGKRKGQLVPGKNSIVDMVPKTEAMMIVVARMHEPGISKTTGQLNYNAITGNYWALSMPPARLKGVGGTSNSELFWDKVKQIADRMVLARHSSSGFLRSCWLPAIRMLAPYASRSAGGGGGQAPMPQVGQKMIKDSGWARPATPGGIYAECEIANAAGTQGINSVLYEKHNEALWAVTRDILQEAINAEAMSTIEHVSSIELKRDKARLAAYGLEV